MRDFIPQIEPWIDGEELSQLTRVIDSTYVTENDLTAEFEQMICKLTGSRYAIAITNGTMALYCCLKALNIGPGDEVIIPNMTFIASSNAVLLAGATPVLCDINTLNFCIDVDRIKELITPNTKAIMPVHLYGQSCDMDVITKIAEENNLAVLEDAAQGVGVKWRGRHVGTFGECGILSFYGNKTITCGEGGVVLTDSIKIRNKVYQLKNHGRLSKGQFKHETIGYNFSFTEMQAAVGIAQMNKLDRIKAKKEHIRNRYNNELDTLLKRVPVDNFCSPVWWFTSFLICNKSTLMKYLLTKGIQTREFFYPLNKQPCYKHMEFAGVKTLKPFPNSRTIFNMGISLPSAYCLTDEEQTYIIDTINDWCNTPERWYDDPTG
jgi:perosamine synthetase